jgi:DNA topoisomerase III
MSVNKLWITEKPEMAKSLAAGLALTFNARVTNQQSMHRDGCLMLDNGDAVGFLFGHMLELAPPEAYLSEEQSHGNPFDYLPLMPESFIKVPKSDRAADSSRTKGKAPPSPQFNRMVQMMRGAREIVNAGDIDREGQLIVDELLLHAGIDPAGGTKPVWRLALTNPKDEEIRKLIKAGLERNSDDKWARRSKAAHVREVFDWCLGMTASRAWKQVTGLRNMSVGRVTTPTLALVVKREVEIENFRAVQYFVPVITLSDGTEMRWFKRRGAEGMDGFDSQGRIVSEPVARQIVSAIMGGCKGEISLAEAVKKFQPPPLPFSMSTLQSTVSRRTGLALKEVTRAAQSLYESKKMITYVGTDCRFLPTSMLAEARDTIASLATLYPKAAHGANLELRSKAWNDSKTDEHFAIAPTGRMATGLSQSERAVFDTVSKRFMAQFYPAHEFLALKLQALFGQDEFKAVDREVTVSGWKDVEYDPEDKEAGDGEDLAVVGDKEAPGRERARHGETE